MSIDLSKYLTFQKKYYTRLYTELSNQYYNAGWVDRVMPRLEVQCDSARSYGTGFNSDKEVRAFWKNKLLRENYINVVKLLNNFDDITTVSARGRFKMKQSLELFIPIAESNDKILLQTLFNKIYCTCD